LLSTAQPLVHRRGADRSVIPASFGPGIAKIPAAHDAFSDAFVEGMSNLGYNEGRNLVVEWRYADGDYTRLSGFANELVGMNLSVIVTYGTAAARELQKSTTSIPVVVAAAVDLVGAGIVASLARPGRNITGLSVIDVDISTKQLELLKAFSPKLTRVAVLLNPGNSANPLVLKRVEAGAERRDQPDRPGAQSHAGERHKERRNGMAFLEIFAADAVTQPAE
jgi:ABC transporter substrate binding protein